MSLVEREQVLDTETFRKDDYGRVRQPDHEVGVALDDLCGATDVGVRDPFEAVCARGDIFEQRSLGVLSDAASEQVVKLGQDKRRQYERPWVRGDRGCSRCVGGLGAVDRCEEAAGVDQDHFSPKPSSSSSARSAIVGSPLSNKGSRGRGRPTRLATYSTPSRINSASLRPLVFAACSRATFKSSGR